MKLTGYITIKVDIECPDGMDEAEVFQAVGSECDYSVKFNQDGIAVTDTELLCLDSDWSGPTLC